MRQRHVPVRTCVACRQERPKRELVRIVRTLAGPVEVDPTGKRAGRGAYLCRDRACWELALKRPAFLGRALKTELSDDDLARLEAFARTLPAASATSTGAAAETPAAATSAGQ
jgi:predicted RNA-binding protein YlxR (DUF448 family)